MFIFNLLFLFQISILFNFQFYLHHSVYSKWTGRWLSSLWLSKEPLHARQSWTCCSNAVVQWGHSHFTRSIRSVRNIREEGVGSSCTHGSGDRWRSSLRRDAFRWFGFWSFKQVFYSWWTDSIVLHSLLKQIVIDFKCKQSKCFLTKLWMVLAFVFYTPAGCTNFISCK